MRQRFLLLLVGFLSLSFFGVATAEVTNESLICAPEEEFLSPSRLVRAWSLDVVGELPMTASSTVVTEDSLAAEIDGLLASPAFAEQVIRFHRDLLWNNISNVNLYAANASLSTAPDISGVYYRRNRATTYRGAADTPCLDEAAELNPDGSLKTTTVDGAQREGWVEVEPYWAKGTLIKVCAFDAQAAEVSPNGVPCSSREGWSEVGCGCGPDLRYCRPLGGLHRTVSGSFSTAVDLLIADVINSGRPYLDIFTANETWVNGPVVHFLRYQTELGGGVRMDPSPIPVSLLPDLQFEDYDTWVKISLPEGHSGVLTSVAFLLRFQTDRARANRFFTNFLCQPFQPPEEGLPVEDESEALNPDLQNRAGCEYCHGMLEPAASYWGRWRESSGGYLNVEDGFMPYDPDCYSCAVSGIVCSAECSAHYQLDPQTPEEEPFIGWLKAYVFREENHHINIEMGPELLVLLSTVNEESALPKCTARKTVEWLLRREVLPGEEEWVQELGKNFVFSNFDYRGLVREIVTSDAYRRVR